MFYTRGKKGEVHPITYDNIYSDCPGCGKYHQIDFELFFNIMDEDGDLDCSVFCEECTEQRRAERRSGLN